MNVPSKRPIRLPISAKTAQSTARLPVKLGESSSAGAKLPICGICRMRDSRYTCPRCNVLYCSLDCFKSESHSQCSEPFYLSSIQSEIATDPKASSDEKLKMLQMLKRFEGSVDDMPDVAELDDDADGDVDEDLLDKLGDIDLDEIDSNQLFHLLPVQHRERFIQLLKDPQSQEAKALLQTFDDVGGEQEEEQPWWLADDEVDIEDIEEVNGPFLIRGEFLNGIQPPAGSGDKLLYNIVAVGIAYAHLVLSFHRRDLSSAPAAERAELRTELSRLLPFLGDTKSTVRFESARRAWEAIWSNVGDELESKADSTTLITLLESVQTLSHPSLVLSDPHPLQRVLGDLHALYASHKEAAPRKLAFYSRALDGIGKERWLAVEKEIAGEIDRLGKELGKGSEVEEREALRVL